MLRRQRMLPVAVALSLAAGCQQDKVASPKPGNGPCLSSGSLALGGTTSGDLSSATCRWSFNGSRIQHYSFTLSQPTAVAFTMTAANGKFDPFLLLYREAYSDTLGIVALNNDADTLTVDSRMSTVLAQGTYVVAGGHLDPNVYGAYTIGASTWSGSAEHCQDVFMTPGTTTQQSVTTTDCTNDAQTLYGDVIWIYLKPNQGVDVSVTSSEAVTQLQLYDAQGAEAARDDNASSGTSTHVSAPATAQGGIYTLIVAAPSTAMGAYTLAIGSTGTASASASAPARGSAVVNGSSRRGPARAVWRRSLAKSAR